MKHVMFTQQVNATVAIKFADQRTPVARDRKVFINIDHNPARALIGGQV